MRRYPFLHWWFFFMYALGVVMSGFDKISFLPESASSEVPRLLVMALALLLAWFVWIPLVLWVLRRMGIDVD